MKKGILATLFLGLILLLAACGGGNEESADDSSNTSGDSGESTEQSAEDSGSAEQATPSTNLDIVATDFEFNKDQYTVPAGEEVTVSLTSKEGTHGIQIENTDVDIQSEGKATFTIDEPGEYMIHCSVPCGEGHSSMMSTLVVK